MNKLIYLILLFISENAMNGNCQQITFEKTYASPGYGISGKKVLQNDDGTYMVVGSAWLGTTTSYGCLMKADTLGNPQWMKIYTDPVYDFHINDIHAAGNNTYLICGEGTLNQSYRSFLAKIDSSGNIIWCHRYGKNHSSGSNQAFSVEVLTDGNYLMCGGTNDFGMGSADIYLIKTDTSGNTIWGKTLGETTYDVATDVELAANGNFVVVAKAGGGTSLSEFDNNGNLNWSKKYFLDHSYDLTQWAVKRCPDNGYAVVGVWTPDTSNFFKPYLLKTDDMGNVQWCKIYSGPSFVGEFFSISVTSDSEFIATWEPEYPCPNCSSGLIKLDSEGNVIWAKNYNINALTFPSSSIQTKDEGFIQVGSYKFTLIKTDKNGSSGCYDTTLHVLSLNIPVIVTSFGTVNSGDSLNYFIPNDAIIPVSVTDNCLATHVVSNFLSPDTFTCPGTCVAFINLATNATSFQWYFPGATPDTSTAGNPTNICYPNPGTYDAQLIAANANGSDTLLLTNYITVYPYPSPQGIAQSGDTLIANQGAVSYQWYLNGSLISGATDYFYVAQASGDYYVVATDGNGCEVEAAIFNVVASTQLAIGNMQFAIFPNPVEDELRVRGSAFGDKEVTITIFDVIGSAVRLRTTNTTLPTELDVRALPSGIYYLEVTGGSKVFRTKIIKQ